MTVRSGYDDDLRLAHVIADQVDGMTTTRFKSLDVALRIAAANPERMQFENFAGEVLVNPGILVAPRLDALARHAVGADRPVLIEVANHRRMHFGSGEHVGEAAHDMGPDRPVFERGDK